MNKQCLACGLTFKAKGHKLYCSGKCQKESKNKKARNLWEITKFDHIRHPNLYQKEKNCSFCNKLFTPNLRHPKQNTCSPLCCRKLRYKLYKDIHLAKCKERYEKIKNSSEYKEKVRITARRWRLNNPEKAKEINKRFKQKHKSEILAKLRKYELKERICAFCTSTFMPNKNHPIAKCCSQKCRNKYWAKRNYEKSKEINIEKSKRYRLKHPEKIKEYTKRLVESGKANINAKRWREKNLERAKELHKKQYWKHRDKILDYANKYRQTEAGKLSHRADSKRRQFARKSKLAIDFPLTRKKQEYIRTRDDNTCVYCYYKPNKITFDHIIAQENSGSNSVNNLVVSCLSCNASKRHIQLEEWLGSNYCKLKRITKDSINPIVWYLLKKQNTQKQLK